MHKKMPTCQSQSCLAVAGEQDALPEGGVNAVPATIFDEDGH